MSEKKKRAPRSDTGTKIIPIAGKKKGFIPHGIESAKKNRQVKILLPKGYWNKYKEKCAQHDLKQQEVFDYLIIQGLAYRSPEVIDFIRAHHKKWLDMQKQYYSWKIGMKTGVTECPELYKESPEWQIFTSYHEDNLAFRRFLISEKLRNAIVYRTLFITGFIEEHPDIMKFIKKCKDSKINQKHRQLAHADKNPRIKRLSERESKKLLERFTEEFDKRKFDVFIDEEVINFFQKDKKKKSKLSVEEQIEEDEFEKKLQKVRALKAKKIDEITEPVDLIDIDDILG